jgi:hypothetical protein
VCWGITGRDNCPVILIRSEELGLRWFLIAVPGAAHGLDLVEGTERVPGRPVVVVLFAEAFTARASASSSDRASTMVEYSV